MLCARITGEHVVGAAPSAELGVALGCREGVETGNRLLEAILVDTELWREFGDRRRSVQPWRGLASHGRAEAVAAEVGQSKIAQPS